MTGMEKVYAEAAKAHGTKEWSDWAAGKSFLYEPGSYEQRCHLAGLEAVARATRTEELELTKLFADGFVAACDSEGTYFGMEKTYRKAARFLEKAPPRG